MIDKSDIQRVKNILSQNEGKRIRLSAKRGKNREIIRFGIIKETYPSIFIVALDSVSDFADSVRTMSFGYTDLLTKSIEITIMDTKTIIE
ncbi:MAG: Veg family protein [Clostridia bacterium]|nr:Veg family protein [Clostridia bacterium]